MTRKNLLAFSAALTFSVLASYHAPAQDGRNSRPAGCSLRFTDSLGGLGEVDLAGFEEDLTFMIANMDALGLRIAFDVKVKMFKLNESDGSNAFFSPRVFDALLRQVKDDPDDWRDGTVFLGSKLTRNEMKDGQRFAISAIVAHEFGHAMQSKNDCKLQGKWRELHADYMAGYWIARTDNVTQVKKAGDSFRSICEKGDYQFNDPQHHGTPKDRGTAFTAGFRCGQQAAVLKPRATLDKAAAAKAYHQGLLIIGHLKEDAGEE